MVGSVTNILDDYRVAVLRITLAKPSLRHILLNRASRLRFLFLISASFSLILSLFFPLWVLIAGPVVYGIPHLFASLRYVHYTGSAAPQDKAIRDHALPFFFAIFTIVATLRIFTDTGFLQSAWLMSSIPWVEMIAMTATFLGGAILYRKDPKEMVLGGLVLSVVWTALLLSPVATVGFLVLGHNVIAFIYWILASKTRDEKQTAWGALVVFLVLSAAVFLGLFDGLYHYYTPLAEVAWAQMNYGDMGKMVAPWSENYIVLFHCTVAYAFGQSVHYFVWMKAIPDQHHRHEVPTTFQESYRLLTQDFGRNAVVGMLLFIAISMALWAFIQYPTARILYFAVAAFHGFFEIAGLALSPRLNRRIPLSNCYEN